MRKKHAFTLVELLVVMAIISILAAIAIPNVQKWILKGKATRAISEISNIELKRRSSTYALMLGDYMSLVSAYFFGTPVYPDRDLQSRRQYD